MSYITYKDIYKQISSRVRVEASGRKKTKAIPYSLYFRIVTKFFEILARDLIVRKQRIFLPLGLGFLYVDKKEHRRAFHIRKDIKESKLKGEPVRYKVPILNDFYYKIQWAKGIKDMIKCKLYPAKKVRELLKDTYNAS
tara:strand:- start:214 stop:630 length:417 start_codon:yes stop_codon:yes gene_type:complete